MTQEIRCGETPDELRSRALSTLTPQLERAGLELIEPGDPTLLYRRRYLPTGPFLLVWLLFAAGVVPFSKAIENDPRLTWLAPAAIAVGALLLLLTRRSEMLAVTVLAHAGGSVAMVAGYANESARISIQHWRPPRAPQLRVLPAPHLRTSSA